MKLKNWLFAKLPLAFLMLGIAASGYGQGLSPSAPTKEYVYFNGRLVAIEERGPAGTSNVVKANGALATLAAAQPPPAPSDTSPKAGKLPVETPAATHTASPK